MNLAGRDAAAEARDDNAGLVVRLGSVPSGPQRTALLQNHLRDQLAVVLKTASQRLDVLKPMGSLGVDSLMALEFVRRLTRSIGIRVPATTVFNYPTIAKLAAHLETRIDGAERGASVAPLTRGAAGGASLATSDAARSLADIHAMSDDDALRALVGDS